MGKVFWNEIATKGKGIEKRESVPVEKG